MNLIEIATWGGAAAGTVVVYEALRWLVVSRVRRRLRDSTKDFIRRHGVRLDRFKLTRRSFMKAELLSDPVIATAIAERAAETGESMAVLRANVEDWINEIVPAFNVLSYYKVGYNAARAAMNLVYEVVLDDEGLVRLRESLPDDAVVVYLMNHRSNADYVLVAYMLARQIAVAFAVGEWARVWPLDVLFRSFGSYFVRRGFRDQLYHTVLRRYVQLTCRFGITQGVFPEGGLSRDGALRPPKIGLLDYIVRIKAEGLESDVLFVPVGINFDRVLEDRVLIGEAKDARPPGLLDKAKGLVVFSVRFPAVICVNLVRVLTGRVKRHGYATAAFGAPVSLNAWLEENPDLFELNREDRKARVGKLAERVMEAIAAVIPATPVPVVALAAAELGEEFSRADLVRSVRGVRERLRAGGVPLVTGRGFEATRTTRERLEEERANRASDLLEFEDEMTASDEAEETVAVALELLQRRKVVTASRDRLRLRVRDPEVLAYYARSISHLAR